MRLGSLLLVGVCFAAVIAVGTVAPAIGPTAAISDGDLSPDTETPPVDLVDLASDPIADLMTTNLMTTDLMEGDLMEGDLEARPLDAYEVDDQTEPTRVEEVPEPATVVSLAGLAAIAGGILLLRRRWFRRS